MFPPGGGPSGFPGIGPSPGAGVLDGTPPTPTPMSEAPPGVDGGAPFSMRGVGGPGGGPVPTDGMPPEVLTGITQSAQAMSDLIDSWAQITPDKAPALSLIKDMVAQYLASLMGAGAGPVSATAPGPAPPMGGMDRGISGPGSI